MKIIFVCRGNRTKTAAAILKALKNIDFMYRGIALTIYEDKWYFSLSSQERELFEKHYGTEDIYSQIGEITQHNCESTYIKYGYDQKEFWNQVFSERYLTQLEHHERFTNPRYSREEILTYSKLCLNKFEHIINTELPDLILDFSSLGFMRGMLYQVAAKYSIPYKTLISSRIFGYSILTDLYGYGIEEVRKEYSRLKRLKGNTNQAIEIINKFRSDKQYLYYGHATARAEKVYFTKKKKGKLLRKVLNRLKYFLRLGNDVVKEFQLRSRAKKSRNLKYNYYLYKFLPSKYCIDAILKEYRRRQFFYWFRKNEKPYPHDSMTRRFLFTMHVQPEASTSVAAPFFCNQEYTIQNICRSLPPDGILLVKPHLQQITVNPLALYQRLSKIPNLYIVSPLVSTCSLIEQSEAVITITGTSGLEAILLGKRTITFSETLYSLSSNVKVFENFKNLKEYLYKGKLEEADEEDVKYLVQAIINSSIQADYFILRKGKKRSQKIATKNQFLSAVKNSAQKIDSYIQGT